MAMRGGCRFSGHSLSASAEWRREEARSFRGGKCSASAPGEAWEGVAQSVLSRPRTGKGGKGGGGRGRGKGKEDGGRSWENEHYLFLFLFFYFILFLFSPSPPFCFPRIWISLFSRSTRGDTQRATSRGRQAFPGSVAYGVGRRPSHSSLASVWTLILAASNGCSCRFHTTCAAPHATQRNGRTTRADIHPNAVPGGAGRGGEARPGLTLVGSRDVQIPADALSGCISYIEHLLLRSRSPQPAPARDGRTARHLPAGRPLSQPSARHQQLERCDGEIRRRLFGCARRGAADGTCAAVAPAVPASHAALAGSQQRVSAARPTTEKGWRPRLMRTDRGARDAAAPDAGGRRRHRTRTRTRTMHTGAWCASAESARSSRTVDLRGGHCSRPPPSVLPAPPHGDRTRSPARRLPRRPLAVAKKKRSARPASGGRTTRGAGERRRRAGGRPSVPPARCPGLLVGRSLFAGPGPASRSQGTTSASHRTRPGQEIDPRRARARLGACPPVAVAPPPFGADSVIVFRARAAFSRLRGLIFSCHRLRHPPPPSAWSGLDFRIAVPACPSPVRVQVEASASTL